MKSALLSLLFAFTAAASAKTPTVLALVEGREAGIDSVALLDNGKLQVTSEEKIRTITLKEEVANKLARAVTRIYDVDVITKKRTTICKMAVRPVSLLSDLSVTAYSDEGRPTGDLRLVLTRRGCYVSVETYPKETQDYAATQSLRDQMVILALDSLK